MPVNDYVYKMIDNNCPRAKAMEANLGTQDTYEGSTAIFVKASERLPRGCSLVITEDFKASKGEGNTQYYNSYVDDAIPKDHYFWAKGVSDTEWRFTQLETKLQALWDAFMALTRITASNEKLLIQIDERTKETNDNNTPS